MPLLHHKGHLEEIRAIVDKFHSESRKIQYKYVSIKKFVDLSGINETLAESILVSLDTLNKSQYKLGYINIYEVWCILISTSFSNKQNKLKCDSK